MIGDLINKIVEVPEIFNSHIGRVVNINKEARTIDVEPLDGTSTIFDVRLQAFIDNTEGVVIFPKNDSEVIVTLLNNQTGFVTSYSEIDYLQFVANDVDLKKELDNMFDLMSSLIDILKQFQLLTNMGTTIQVMPNVVVDLEKLKQKNEQIKSQFNKIIK
jgi:hypothetical protein